MPARLDEVCVVSHTHWDREWYHTAERFRVRLVRLIDELLDDPPAAGASFLLDGQAVLLDDYLDVRPERAGELSAQLQRGSLEAGPWYVLADELIPGAEALVRNLQLGVATLRRLRADPPPVLYCPDSFGHPAILPELAAGFGYGLIILWRGFGGGRSPDADLLQWRGPSGAVALVYHLPPDGYEFGSSLPGSAGDAAARWQGISSVLGARTSTGTALLLNGADHHAKQLNLDRALAALTAAARPVRIRAASLREAAASLARSAANAELPVITGELRDSYGYTWTLQGTFGTRSAQKRRNAHAERALVRDLEPWLAQAGEFQARSLLTSAWRTLLTAHPHDTLCGTSIDEVAQAFEGRLGAVEAQASELRSWGIRSLLRSDVDAERHEAGASRPAVIIRNPASRERGGVVELRLSAKVADVAVGPGSASRQGARRRVPPWRVNGLAVQVLSRTERTALTESPRAYPDADVVAEAVAVGWMETVPGYSICTRFQRGASVQQVLNPVAAKARTLTNGRVTIEVDDAGRITFEDLELGTRIEDAVVLERARDAGDLYTPAIRETLPGPRVRRIRLVHAGPIRGELAVDLEFPRSGGMRSSCRLSLQLDADARAMRVILHGENRDRDQRLRLMVATGAGRASTIADAAFFPVRRNATRIPADDARMEAVVPTAPLHRWVARFGDSRGAVLVADGLAEYESLDDGRVAVTLVRSVGELSRVDLPERPGHAGWPATTPDAQGIGEYDARFALQLLSGDTLAERSVIERLAEDFLTPLIGETNRSNLQEEQVVGRIELSGDGLTFSAATPAQREGWITLRCVNQRDTAVAGTWRLPRNVVEAIETRLDEQAIGPVHADGSVVRFTAAPRAVVTIIAR